MMTQRTQTILATALATVAFFTTFMLLQKRAESKSQPEQQQPQLQQQEPVATEQDFCKGIAYISCATTQNSNVVKEQMPGSMQQIIAEQTMKVPDAIAIRIAKCESNLNPRAQNPGSSAYGLFQFTKSTWDNYCLGNITDTYDQIQCFDELYPIHPTWWECS